MNQGGDLLNLMVAPNPSVNYFNISIKSKLTTPSTVIVTDILGNVVERHERVSANSQLQLGRQLKTGVYFVSVVQGNQRKTVMVVKAL